MLKRTVKGRIDSAAARTMILARFEDGDALLRIDVETWLDEVTAGCHCDCLPCADCKGPENLLEVEDR